MPLLDWILANAGVDSAAATGVMAVVWLVYLQLIYVSFRAERRSMITITRAMGNGKEVHCLISNMSAAPIYVLTILAALDDDKGSWICTITDEDDLTEKEGSTEYTHQGTLARGGYIDLGPFGKMIRCARRVDASDAGDGGTLTGIKIVVVALNGSSRRFVGASRRFKRAESGPFQLRPTTLESEQLTGPLSRRSREQLLTEEL